MALIRDTRSALAVRIIRILHSGWLSCDQRVLAVIDGASIRVRYAGVRTVRHTAVDRERSAAIVARSCALKFVDRTELRDRTPEGIDAGRPGTVECAGELPGREGIDLIVSALEDGARGIKDRISKSSWRQQVDVKGTDQVLSTHIEQRYGHRGAIDDLSFEGHARLLHPRSHEVRGECRNIMSDSLCETLRELTIRCIEWTTHKRIGI